MNKAKAAAPQLPAQGAAAKLFERPAGAKPNDVVTLPLLVGSISPI